MKKIAVISIGLTLVAMMIAIFASLNLRNEPDPPPPPPPELDELIPEGVRADKDIALNILLGEDAREMTMERFLIGVIAAEMPASFELEALKAQAVAARTDTMYHTKIARKPRHPDADICGDYSCCMAYTSDTALREKWGDDYLSYIMKIISAVIETDGVYIMYENEPILAVFHSSSAGMTENSGSVWLNDLPYLQSVPSPESESEVPNFVSSVTVSLDDFANTVTGAFPNTDFTGAPETWIMDITKTPGGRIETVTLGGETIAGTRLRSLFNLRSTAVSIELRGGDIVLTTTGYGHGVGMSQYGANTMAMQGKSYRDILSSYYTGVTITEGGAMTAV